METKQYLREPTIDQLEEWFMDGICMAKCEHGCMVEPDGTCEHGKKSWLLEMGLI